MCISLNLSIERKSAVDNSHGLPSFHAAKLLSLLQMLEILRFSCQNKYLAVYKRFSFCVHYSASCENGHTECVCNERVLDGLGKVQRNMVGVNRESLVHHEP